MLTVDRKPARSALGFLHNLWQAELCTIPAMERDHFDGHSGNLQNALENAVVDLRLSSTAKHPAEKATVSNQSKALFWNELCRFMTR